MTVLREGSRCCCWSCHCEIQVEDVDEEVAFNSLQVRLPQSRLVYTSAVHTVRVPRWEGRASYPKRTSMVMIDALKAYQGTRRIQHAHWSFLMHWGLIYNCFCFTNIYLGL